MKVIVSLFVISVIHITLVSPATTGTFVFFDDDKSHGKHPVITPPVLPYIEHLEHDPTTLQKADNELVPKGRNKGGDVSPRFGFSGGFGVQPTGDGGFSAAISHGFSGLGGGSQSASQSFSIGGISKGNIQASHSASQAASFGGSFGSDGSLSGSQASSQAGSFSSGQNGIPSSFSGASAASIAGNGFSGSQAQSSAGSFGFNGSPEDKKLPAHPSKFGGSFAGSQSASGGFGFGGDKEAPPPKAPEPKPSDHGGDDDKNKDFNFNFANSQSNAASFQSRLPKPQPNAKPISSVLTAKTISARNPIVFPGPVNNQYRNPFGRFLSTGLVPPLRERMPFRPFSVKPSSYRIFRIEV